MTAARILIPFACNALLAIGFVLTVALSPGAVQ